jgi:hypothetical protein
MVVAREGSHVNPTICRARIADLAAGKRSNPDLATGRLHKKVGADLQIIEKRRTNGESTLGHFYFSYSFGEIL